MDPFRPLLARLRPIFLWRHWPRLRATLILLHLLAVTAVACPAPVRGSSKKVWRQPAVRAELVAWQRRLHSVGVVITVDELGEFGRATSERWSDARNHVVLPFLKYVKTVGVPQGWYMFTAPDRNPQRLAVVAIDEGGVEHSVFTFGREVQEPGFIDPDFLDEHRVRRAVFQSSWSERPTVLKEVCSWFGRRVQQNSPTIKEVLCTQIEFQVVHPWNDETLAPERARKSVRVALTPATSPASPAAPNATTNTTTNTTNTTTNTTTGTEAP